MVHLDNHLTEVQADTRALDMQGTGTAALVEPVEDLMDIALDAHARIDDLNHGHLMLIGYTHLDGSTVIGVLKSIREQIVDNLIQCGTVEPYIQPVNSRQIAEIDVPFPGCVLIGFQDIAQILYDVSLLALESHLLFVDLPDIQDLIDEVLHAPGVMLDGLQFIPGLRILLLFQQLMQRTHDKCQRRADIVGGIDQELHLFLVKLLLAASDIEPHEDSQHQERP